MNKKQQQNSKKAESLYEEKEQLKGLVFSIEEFSVYDGPGIRTTVFFKGCPLSCQWCHNPEGLSGKRQLVKNPNGCTNCGKCKSVCAQSENCILCGECVKVCPRKLLRICGTLYTPQSLEQKLTRNLDILNSNGGGITFSGGECLMQADFLIEVLKRLKGKTHLAIQTSGYGDGEKFDKILALVDLVLFDLKLIDEEESKKWCGQSNRKIMDNFNRLTSSKTPYIIRVPLIPLVTDTVENLSAIARLAASKGSRTVEIMPYNKMAGGKYALVGIEYNPNFDVTAEPNPRKELFEKEGIIIKIL